MTTYTPAKTTQIISSLALALLAGGLFLYLVNLKPLYVIEALLDASRSEAHRPVNGSLKGLDRSLRRTIWASYRLNQASSNLNFAQKLALLKSDDLLLEFIHKHRLKPKLFPGLWDEEKKRWKKKQGWLSRLGTNSDELILSVNNEPKNYKAVNLLSKRLKLNVDKRTSLIFARLTWKIPEEGKELLDNFIVFANNYMLNKDKERVEESIKSINNLMKEQRVEIKNALIEKKTQLETMAAMINPVLSPPFKIVVPTKRPTVPKLRLPIVATLFVFIVCFITSYALMAFLQRRKLIKQKTTSTIE